MKDPTPNDPLSLTLSEAADALAARTISAVDLTTRCLDRIAATQPVINSVIALEAEQALDSAKAADADLAAGRSRGVLHGVPMMHKDMYYRAGRVSTCGSAIRRDFRPDTPSTALARLAAAGALQLGTLNMSEFASSPTGHNEHWGDCCNPWAPDRVPGGSSSGSGAAVGARQVFAALGSDTGGSIRIPAALCGVTGLKATYGRISRAGAMPLSFSMDHVGPLAVSARDCARLLTVMAGADPLDPTCSSAAVPDYEAGIDAGIRGLRVGLATGFFAEGVDPEVAAATVRMADVLRDLGATVQEIEIPEVAAIGALGMVLSRSESATLHAEWLRTRPDDYTLLVREMLQIGLGFSAVDYIQALSMRAAYLDRVHAEVFGVVDLVLTPTCPIPAPTRAETRPGVEGYMAPNAALPRFTRPFNYLGVPALALPAGFTAAGLPVSVQLVGRSFDEATVLRAGHAIQTETDWHRRSAPL